MAVYTLPTTERVYWGDDVLAEMDGELERVGASNVLILVTPVLRNAPVASRLRGIVGDRCAAVSHDVSQHVPSAVVDPDALQSAAGVSRVAAGAGPACRGRTGIRRSGT